MKNILITLGICFGLVIALALYAIGVRNRVITMDENAESQLQNISVQLERRTDLIPNLVETVKGYAAHESDIFTEVAQARSRLLAAKTPEAMASANGALDHALGRLLAIGENYPQLKANENFLRLQDELAGTENRIAVARKNYNDAVKAYNTAIRKFPASLLAAGFEKRDYYEVPEGKDVNTVPSVKF